MTIDEKKLEGFVHKVLGDVGATGTAGLAIIGDRLGLYKAMAGAGPLSPAELAAKTGTNERCIREWLSAQAAAEYVDYDPATGRFTLPDEHAAVLADDTSPASMMGGLLGFTAMIKAQEKIVEAFKKDGALGWHEHHPDLFEGTRRLFHPGYMANLVDQWIPALEGVRDKLEQGAKVADVGCGHGASTLIMAKAFPKTTFAGFDVHPPSIDKARDLAAEAGLDGRVNFEVATAKTFPGSDYDLVAFFDCLHDMGDPVGAARYVRKALKPDGAFMLIEPFAGDKLEDNINPVGRVYYNASTMVCTPCSLSQEVGLGLGAQAGEERLRTVLKEAGFTRFRRATETPMNLVLEARP
jgi:SAM-dependent methyltransferase